MHWTNRSANQVSTANLQQEPLVSCIIVFWNAEGYLDQAIESVFSQSYESYELILVDDGSSDGSSEKARDVARKHPGKVHYADHPNHENRGISCSRNLGISLARGRYIAFLDSDDVWLPEKLEEQVLLLEGNPQVGMVYGLDEYWYSWSASTPRPDFLHQLGISSGKTFAPPRLVSALLRNTIAIPTPSNPLILRHSIEQVGGFEEQFPTIYEDQAFYFKFWSRVPVMPVDRCWTRYRKHPDSVCARVRQNGTLDSSRRKFLEWTKTYVQSHEESPFVVRVTIWFELLQLKSSLVRGLVRYWGYFKKLLRRLSDRFVGTL